MRASDYIATWTEYNPQFEGDRRCPLCWSRNEDSLLEFERRFYGGIIRVRCHRCASEYLIDEAYARAMGVFTEALKS